MQRRSRLVSSAMPRHRDQVSIWSVARRDARTFFVIAGTLWVVAMMFIVYKSWDDLLPQAAMPQAGWRRVGDLVLGVLTDFSPVGIAIAILSMILAPGANYTGDVAMTFYQAMVNKFVIPVIEAHKAEGREEGREEGRGGGPEGEGRTEVVEAVRAWNERRLAAEREGRQFDEPLPGDNAPVDHQRS